MIFAKLSDTGPEFLQPADDLSVLQWDTYVRKKSHTSGFPHLSIESNEKAFSNIILIQIISLMNHLDWFVKPFWPIQWKVTQITCQAHK